MFIKQAFNYKHEFWRYLVGSFIVFVAAIIGQLPLGGVLVFQSMEQGMGLSGVTEENMYTLLESNLFLFLMLISFVFALIALYFVVKYLHQQKFVSVATSRPKLDWRRIWFAFFFWGILSTTLVVIDALVLSPDDYVVNLEWPRFVILAIIAICLIPLQTSLEEYLFRGYLMQGFGTLAKNRWFPLLLTSVIFGGLHIANPEVGKLGYSIMVYYIGTGLFLGIMTLMDEGLELALGFHAANNLFTALLVTSDWTAFQTHSIFKDISEPEIGFIDMFLPVFIIFPVMLLIFAKVYRWNNWKEKLFGKIEEPAEENYKVIE
ncbi:MAG: type II CAAX endopeptidase family protein [Flavobacteriaceae bacterium]|nr:type II CAAX endopeptidase family protein [Flavobacteriaceae bacterium]